MSNPWDQEYKTPPPVGTVVSSTVNASTLKPGDTVGASRLGPTIQAAEALQPEKIKFDYQTAREDGLSVAQIADLIAAEAQYDIEAARKDGQTDYDIITEFTDLRDPGKLVTVAEGVNRGITETGGMGLGAYGGFKAGLPVSAAVGAAFPPAAPVTVPVTLGAFTIGGALTGGYLINELNEYFFPEAPVRRALYEGGRTFGGTAVTFPIPFAVAGGGSAVVGPAMFIREYVKKVAPEAAEKTGATLFSKPGLKSFFASKPYGSKATPLEKILETAATRPLAFATAELGAGVSSSIAGGLAEENDPGNVLTRTSAELLGAVFNPTQTIKILSPAISPIRQSISQLSTSGRANKLGRKLVTILEKAGEDPEAVIKALRSDRELAELAAEAGVDLDDTTAAGKALSPVLAKLQADISSDLKAGPTLERAALQNLTSLNKVVELMISMDDPSLLGAASEVQRNLYDEMLQSRLTQVEAKATATAGKIISASPTDAKKAGEVVEVQTRQVLDQARTQEKALYTKIDKKEPAEAGSVISKFDELTGELLPESPFPSLIRRFVGRVSGRDADVPEDAVVGQIAALNKELAAAQKKFKTLSAKGGVAEDELFGAYPDLFRAPQQGNQKAIRDLGNIVADYRAKGSDQRGSSLDSTTRNRVAQLAEAKIAELLATEEITFLRSQQSRATAEAAEQVSELPEITVGDLTAFRSEMLSMARDARAAGNYRDSNFYGQMAEAALDDLGLASQMNGPKTQNQLNLQAAHNFSRALNDVFTRAFSGEILGKSRTGAAKLPPELVFDTIMRGSANATNLRLSQLQDAARFMAENAGEEFADSAAARLGTVRGAQATMLQGQASNFYNPATGRVNMNGLTTWMRQNDETLSMFPTLKKDLSESVTAQKLLSDAKKDDSIFRKSLNEQLSLATFFGNFETPGAAVGTLIGTPGNRPPNPASNLNATIKSAKTAGREVEQGLVSAIFDHAYTEAGLDQVTGTGVPAGTFKAFKDYLFKPLARGQQSVMGIMRQQGLFSDTEATRLNTILREASFIEDALINGERGNYNLKDAPSAIYDLVVKVGGLLGGKQISNFTGRTQGLVEAGMGIQFAQNKFQHMPNTYFNDLLLEAVKNPEMMETLLERGLQNKRPNYQIKFNRQLNAALVNAGLTPPEDQIQESEFNLTLPMSAAQAETSSEEIQQYLNSLNTPPSQPAPVNLPNTAPPSVVTGAPPVRQVPPRLPAAGQPNSTERQNYATLFPNDPISGLINSRQQGPR